MMPTDEAANMTRFMLSKSQSRRDLIIKAGLIVGGIFGIGALLWFFFKPEKTVGHGLPVHEAQTVDELVNTPITNPVPIVQTPAIHLTLGRSACEDALIHYNGALRSHPDLAEQIKADAKAAGCGWAQ